MRTYANGSVRNRRRIVLVPIAQDPIMIARHASEQRVVGTGVALPFAYVASRLFPPPRRPPRVWRYKNDRNPRYTVQHMSLQHIR